MSNKPETKGSVVEAPERWAGIDDEYEEKQPGSGAVYDAATGEFLFRVPPQYRQLVVAAVNSYQPDVQAADAAAKAFPTGWLDPLLTGPNAAVGEPPFDCADVERLLMRLKERVLAALAASPVQADGVSEEYKAGMRDGQAVGYMARDAEAAKERVQAYEVPRALENLRKAFPDNCIELGVDAGGWWLFTRTNKDGFQHTLGEGATLSECMAHVREWRNENQ